MTWELWLNTDRGKRLQTLPTTVGFGCTRVLNTVGSHYVVLPESFDHTLVDEDYMIEYWRGNKLITVGLVRNLKLVEMGGDDISQLSGPTHEDLLVARIIAYAAGSSQADKTDFLDDMMKEIISENFGASATDTDRDWSGQNFTISSDVSGAPSDSKAFAWRDVDKVLKDLALMSEEGGTRLFFDLVPTFSGNDTIGFDFRTYTGQLGRDRTGTNQTVFSKERGNLIEPKYEKDWSDEKTYIYGGGQGDGSNRYIAEQSDTTRINASIWNRREGFTDARNEKSQTAVDAKANQVLQDGKPVERFSGKLLDTQSTRYGRDWEFGDLVVVEYRGLQFTALVNTVVFDVDEKGEKISGRFRIV